MVQDMADHRRPVRNGGQRIRVPQSIGRGAWDIIEVVGQLSCPRFDQTGRAMQLRPVQKDIAHLAPAVIDPFVGRGREVNDLPQQVEGFGRIGGQP